MHNLILSEKYIKIYSRKCLLLQISMAKGQHILEDNINFKNISNRLPAYCLFYWIAQVYYRERKILLQQDRSCTCFSQIKFIAAKGTASLRIMNFSILKKYLNTGSKLNF